MVDLNGVKIVGHANMPARLAPATSALYARNLLNFVDLLIDPKTKQPVDGAGTYVTVFKKQADGTWKAVADVATPTGG